MPSKRSEHPFQGDVSRTVPFGGWQRGAYNGHDSSPKVPLLGIWRIHEVFPLSGWLVVVAFTAQRKPLTAPSKNPVKCKKERKASQPLSNTANHCQPLAARNLCQPLATTRGGWPPGGPSSTRIVLFSAGGAAPGLGTAAGGRPSPAFLAPAGKTWWHKPENHRLEKALRHELGVFHPARFFWPISWPKNRGRGR